MDVRDTLLHFDQYLGERGITMQLTVAGGAAIILHGYSKRPTVDFDLLRMQFVPSPQDIPRLTREFRESSVGQALGLEENWINFAVDAHEGVLPDNWEDRRVPVYDSPNLKVLALGRADLLILKLDAATDRGARDINDIMAMKPTPAEFQTARDHLLDLCQRFHWTDLVETVTVVSSKITQALKDREAGHER